MTVDIPSLVQAAGARVVGKVRLQKLVYLLDQMGLNSGFAFEYRHYGPYSENLAEQVEDDIFFGRMQASPGRRQTDGVPYLIYQSNGQGDGEPIDSHMPIDRIDSALAELQRQSATVLELAATIHWLAVIEGLPDWRDELFRRKGAKAQEGRDREALELLSTLGLPPGVSRREIL